MHGFSTVRGISVRDVLVDVPSVGAGTCWRFTHLVRAGAQLGSGPRACSGCARLDVTAAIAIALPLLVQLSGGAAMAQNRPDWMWAEALQLLDQAERAHRDLFRPSGTRRRTACWEPPVDVFETDDEVWLQVALPGVGADQVEVRLEDGGIGRRRRAHPADAAWRRRDPPPGDAARLLRAPHRAGGRPLRADPPRARARLPHPHPAQAGLTPMADQPNVTSNCRRTSCRWCRSATWSCFPAPWCR